MPKSRSTDPAADKTFANIEAAIAQTGKDHIALEDKVLQQMRDKHELTKAYAVIVGYLRSNTANAALLKNFEGTEDRCVKAIFECMKSDADIAVRLAEILGSNFPVDVADNAREGMITQGPITINSHCPHHLFPVRYTAYVSYLPKDGRVLGLSKLARIAKTLGRRPVLHEQLASDIADVLFEGGNAHQSDGFTVRPDAFPGAYSAGSAVQLTGAHTCMACRGIEEDALTQVTELRGKFWTDNFEEKFYQAVASLKSTKVF